MLQHNEVASCLLLRIEEIIDEDDDADEALPQRSNFFRETKTLR